MNQDPNNPVMPNPIPTATDFSNPATAATPIMAAPAPEAPAATPAMAPEAPVMQQPTMPPAPEPTAPEAPVTPNMPAIDESLIQEAIADVPAEAVASPEAAPALSINSSDADTPASEASPFAGAAPAMDTTPTAPAPEATANPADPAAATNAPANPAENAAKNPPSIAFNDPAQQPDAGSQASKKASAIVQKIKENPVAVIVITAAIVIVALVLIIANV